MTISLHEAYSTFKISTTKKDSRENSRSKGDANFIKERETQ